MQKTNPKGYSGLLLMDSRLSPSTFSGTVADLSQQGPMPGVPVPQQDGTEAAPRTSGTQDDTRYLLRTQRGGFVGRSTFAWATQVEGAVSDYRGCNLPNFAQDVRHAGGKVTTATNGPAAQCTTSSDRVVRVWAETGATSPFYQRVYAAYSDDLITWTGHDESILILSEDPDDTAAYYGVTLNSTRCVAVRWDDDRSVVQLFVRVTLPGGDAVNYHLFESADGSAWSLAQPNVLDESFTPNLPGDMKMPVVYAQAGAYALLQPEDDGANYYLTQFVGSDRGRNMTLLSSDTTPSDYQGFCAAEYNGGVILSLVEPSTGDVKVATLSSAFDAVLSADFQTVPGMTSEAEACLSACNGLLYLFHTDTAHFMVSVSVSSSGEYNDFAEFGHSPFSYDASANHVDVEDIVASPHGGGIAFGYRANDTGVSSTVRGMHFVHRMGGWCTRTLPPTSPIVGGDGRVGFGPFNSSVDAYYQADRKSWYPLIDPATLGYTATGAGTDAFAHTAGGSPAWTVSCTAGQARYWTSPTFSAEFTAGILVFFDAVVGTGGDGAANDSALRVILGDGVYEYRLAVRLSAANGVYLKDENTGSGATRVLTSAMTTRRRFLLAVREYDSTTPLARARIYAASYSSEGVMQDLQELGGITLTKDATPLYAGCVVEWGVVSTASAVAITQSWYAVHYVGAAGQASIHDLSLLASSSEDFPLQLGGAPCSASPATVSGGLKVSWSGGPSKRGEVWELDPRYAYAREHVYPSLYPSPRTEWRSAADGTDMTFQWDYDEDTILEGFESASVGMLLHRTNLRQARLIGVDAGGDTDLIILDSSEEFTDLDYYAPAVAGSTGPYLTVDPDGTARAGRIFQENEFAGGYALISGSYFRIRKSTAGSWDPTVTGKKPRIWLEEWDGGVVATLGTVTLIPPSSLTVVHGLGGLAFKRLKLFIPAQDTAEGYYRIGQLVVGPLYLFDKRYSHGRVLSRTANVTLNASLSGAREAVRNGPTSREVKFGWFEGQDARQVDAGYADAEPDYVTPGETDSSDYALSMSGELRTTLDGLYDALSGPLVPVVYVPHVPYGEGQHTTTRPDGFLYGRTTEPLEFTTVRGTETQDEVFQVAQVTVSEDV